MMCAGFLGNFALDDMKALKIESSIFS